MDSFKNALVKLNYLGRNNYSILLGHVGIEWNERRSLAMQDAITSRLLPFRVESKSEESSAALWLSEKGESSVWATTIIYRF